VGTATVTFEELLATVVAEENVVATGFGILSEGCCPRLAMG
jgi:hypothetical protein